MQWLKDRALSLMLFAIGFAALGVTVAINKYFGVSQAATAEGQMLSGSIAVIIDLALVALGIAAGALLRSREPMRKAIGVLAFVLMLACALASVISVLGFLGAERISVSKAQEKQAQLVAARAAAQAAAEKAKVDAQIAMTQDNVKWMQGTAKQSGMGKKGAETRRDMIDGMTKSVEALGKSGATLAPTTPVEVVARTDEQVEMIAALIGINKDTAQLTILAYVSILVIVLKSSLFPIGAYTWGATKPGLPQSVTDPIVHGLPNEAQVTVVMPPPPAIPPPQPQKMLPSPLSRPEPASEGRSALSRIGFPRSAPTGEARAMTDAERETLGLRMLTWFTAHGIRGDFAPDALWQIMLEYFAAAGVVPCAERIAKPSLGDVHKGRKYYAIKTDNSPVVWTIRLPDFEELHALLDRDGFPAATKASRKVLPENPTGPAAAAPEAPAPVEAPRPFLMWNRDAKAG